MNTVPELGDPKAVQAQAPANANATLNADYSISLDWEIENLASGALAPPRG